MNTNFEAISSLVELLVKKAGFDLTKDYSETELEKTKQNISLLIKEKNSSNNKKAISSIIENLKVRQANWENNAEIVGKSIIKAYEEGKDYPSVKARIELLGNLALKGTEDISVGYLYDKLKQLETNYNELLNKLETNDYKNDSEKEMDIRYKSYLENKTSALEKELESLNKELESLREVELKDVSITSRIKEYISKLESDKNKIDKIVNTSLNSDVQYDIWERLEKVKSDNKEKLEKAIELLNKTEEMLDGVRKNRLNINERKNTLEDEKYICTNKLNNVKNKLERNEYINTTEKIIDLSTSEQMRLEIESLKNKKDVIYVDALKVKEELIREWNKERDVKLTNISKEETSEKEENLERKEVWKEKLEREDIKEIVQTKKVAEETKTEEVKEKEEIKKNKVELDW